MTLFVSTVSSLPSGVSSFGSTACVGCDVVVVVRVTVIVSVSSGSRSYTFVASVGEATVICSLRTL